MRVRGGERTGFSGGFPAPFKVRALTKGARYRTKAQRDSEHSGEPENGVPGNGTGFPNNGTACHSSSLNGLRAHIIQPRVLGSEPRARVRECRGTLAKATLLCVFLAVPTVVREVPTASGSFQRYKWTGCFSLTRSPKLTEHARAAWRRRPSYIVAYGNKTSFSCSSFNSKKTDDEARPAVPWNAALNYSSGAGVCKSSERERVLHRRQLQLQFTHRGHSESPEKKGKECTSSRRHRKKRRNTTHIPTFIVQLHARQTVDEQMPDFSNFFFLSPLPGHT